MTNQERYSLFKEAQAQGFVGGDITDPNDCNSYCCHCPAEPACAEMSKGGQYPIFREAYTEMIKEMEHE